MPKLREYEGERRRYLEGERYYTLDGTIKLKLKGVDKGANASGIERKNENDKGAYAQLSASNVHVNLKCTVGYSSTTLNDGVVMCILTLSQFEETGKVEIKIDPGTLTDNNGNVNQGQTIQTAAVVKKRPEWTIEDVTRNPVAILNGEEIVLTPENGYEYYGKVVTNYKTPGKKEKVQTKTSNYSGNNTFEVSTTYRLYYIDWDDKYGDGPGTVYLKAENSGPCTLATGFTYNETTSKLKQMNPSLFAREMTPPETDSETMKGVSWLLDTEEWSGLIAGAVGTEFQRSVNYAIGAPSLEMFCDSYNEHYGLARETSMTGPSGNVPESRRVKLWYRCTQTNTGIGYEVGPYVTATGDLGYYMSTFTGSVIGDSVYDNFYGYGLSNIGRYWIASPGIGGWASICCVTRDRSYTYLPYENWVSGAAPHWSGGLGPVVSVDIIDGLRLEM